MLDVLEHICDTDTHGLWIRWLDLQEHGEELRLVNVQKASQTERLDRQQHTASLGQASGRTWRGQEEQGIRTSRETAGGWVLI